jgi:Escherichia/Staphylococcus phage prohead protease
MLERRFSVSNLATKRSGAGGASGDSRVLTGHAALYDSLSQDLGGFFECIRMNVFFNALQDSPNVVALFNHDNSMVLGRTTAGTLTLEDDGTGLYFECSLPNTTVANDLLENVRLKNISQCSFGFYCLSDTWCRGADYLGSESVDPDAIIREVTSLALTDVSIVTTPAYLDTDVSEAD